MARLAFITGASSGIGQALASRFYAAGYALALLARRTGEIQAWAASSGLEPLRYRIYHADVSDVGSIVAAAHACLAPDRHG
ncbi:MAG: SDR family NAD(P)-dependent oxidoreductase, partial [Betaproteobacteria bacterium]